MAIYHFAVGVVSRGKGQSVVAKAAYNARAELTNENTGEAHDYTRAEGLLFSGIFAPKDAPEWVHDREKLWSEVEKGEKRKDAQLARNIELSLPHELTDEQRERLLKDFVRENFVRLGMVADVAIHAPDREGDERNHHAHILLTMRELGPEGFGAKVREWNSKGQLEAWRENWERTANRYLERFGHDARIDCRTLAAQGIDREATKHLGPTASQMEREGVATDRGGINREILATNEQREMLKEIGGGVDRALEATERQQAQEKIQEAYNALQRGKIAHALHTNTQFLDLALNLQKQGFDLARTAYGVLAVAQSGYCYKAPLSDGLKEDLQELEAGGLILPSVQEIREGKQAKRDERREDYEKRKEDKARSDARKGATLYDHGSMASQQQDANRHARDHQKAATAYHAQQQREEAAAERKEETQRATLQRTAQEQDKAKAAEQEKAKREEQEKKAKQPQPAPTKERTDRKQNYSQKEIMRELFEKQFGVRIKTSRDDHDRDRERER